MPHKNMNKINQKHYFFFSKEEKELNRLINRVSHHAAGESPQRDTTGRPSFTMYVLSLYFRRNKLAALSASVSDSRGEGSDLY